MPKTLSVCRCGQPMTDNGAGTVYCEHCDRGCKKPFCSTCKTFQKACDPHCGCQA